MYVSIRCMYSVWMEVRGVYVSWRESCAVEFCVLLGVGGQFSCECLLQDLLGPIFRLYRCCGRSAMTAAFAFTAWLGNRGTGNGRVILLQIMRGERMPSRIGIN